MTSDNAKKHNAVTLRLSINEGELVVGRLIEFAGRNARLTKLAKAADVINEYLGYDALAAELVED